MKRLIFLCMGLFTASMLFAQSPAAFKYQAVARDASGAILANKNVSFRMSILKGTNTGTIVYTERHYTKTNEFGLVSLDVGKGTIDTGTLAGISWGTDNFFINVEMDPNGTNAFQFMGCHQLLSVPYALHAKTVEIDQVNDADSDPTNEIQALQLSGNHLTLTLGGGTVTLPATGDNWGSQYALTDVTISGNGTGSFPLTLAQQGATEGQVLKWNGTSWKPAADATGSGGNPTGPAGGDLAGTYPNPLIGDGKVTSSKIADGAVANAELANDAINSAKIIDGSIVTADLASSTVTNDKINSGAVTGDKIAQSGAITGQVMKWNGTTWAPADDATGSGGSNPTGPAGGDLAGTYPDPLIGDGKVTSAKILDGTITKGDLADNSVISSSILDGSVGKDDLANSAVITDKLAAGAVTTDKINAGAVTGAKIAQSGATTGQALKWNGSTWAPANDETGGGGLTLPYSGGVSSTNPAFQVTNTGNGEGIKGTATSASKTGIIGEAPNQAIFGHATASSGAAYGVQGTSESSTGSGVTGNGASTTGQNFGIRGLSSSNEGKGVYGYALAGSGTTYGVYGLSESSSGNGVYGEGKIALHGVTSAANGYGIYVECTDAGSTPRGVYSSVAAGFSGYFAGGDFYVGGDTGIGVVSPSQKLDVNGNARIRSIGSGAYFGPVNRTSDGTLTTATSDGRLKENVHTLQNSLEKVMQLRGVSFTWKTNPEYGTRIGFIAQEFEEVVPELVFTNETDGYKGINYAEVSALLVEAIKELKAENNKLKIKSQLQETRIESMESRLSSLEKTLRVSGTKSE